MIVAVVAVIAATSLVGFAIWTWRLGQLARMAPPPPRQRAWRTSIVVPARDEAANLPALLASLARLDPPPTEVIVVDDHSTDATAAIARAHGVRVVVPPPLPDGWTGKPWACHHGAAAATGDALLFTDADTVHAPWSLDRATAALDRADVVTAIPTHIAARAWEQLQGPFHLLLLIATRAGARGRGTRRFGIGQYLLFRRDAYDRIGGHAAARAVIAEDLALAALADDAGLAVEVLAAPALVAVRMYPDGLGDFGRGWRRSFRDGLARAGGAGVLETTAVVGWQLGVPLLAGVAAAAGSIALGGAAAALWLATAAAIARRQRLIGALPWWSALAFPLAVAAFVAISAAAAIDHARGTPVLWRGRRIVPTAVRRR